MRILYVVFCAVIVLETAHLFSPLLLAWSSGSFRNLMLRAPVKYVALPIAACGSGLLAPFGLTSLVFYWWNIYHFGMQNYGVLALWRGRQALAVKGLCLLVTGGGMILPIFLHSQLANLIAFVTLSVTHWLTDIGLSAWRSRHACAFIVTVVLLGMVGFIWFLPHDHGYTKRSAQLAQFAMSLSFIHFLYSRWLWKLSDPQVRTAMGDNLFRRSRPQSEV
jgi:hypothetical protein